MSMISKHNSKTWTDSERVYTHVYTEEFYLEIHHNVRDEEKIFVSSKNLGINTSNCKVGGWLSWEQFQSQDGTNKFHLKYPFSISNNGEYWIEVIYHSLMEGTYNTTWDIDGTSTVMPLKASDNFLNRTTLKKELQKGDHEFQLSVDPNLCILGVIVKKIETYGADHNLSNKNKLTCTSVSHTCSDKVGADELSFVLLYDSDYKDPESLTDFLFDYRDEVNFHVMNSNGEMEQIFGGYVSTCTVNADETLLTVKCAGRLIDGEKRHIVEEISVGGDASTLTDEHRAEDIQRFENYNGAIDYLFGSLEVPLNSNMSEVFKEKDYECIDIDVTKKENYNKLQKTNMTASLEPLGVYLRNASGANQTQSIKLYDSDWYNTPPHCIDEYPIFYMTYGMGEPMKSTTVTSDSDSDGTTGVSSNGSVITVRAKPSCGCCTQPYAWYTKSWKNYCPSCKKSGTLHDTPKGLGNVPEHELTCGDGKAPWGDGCDSDFCGVCGGDKAGGGKCRRNKLIPASASENTNSGNTETTKKSSEKSLSNIFQTITNEAFKYRYKLRGGTCSSWSCMKSAGYGDCWAFSDLIYTRLKEAGVGAKISQYVTSGSSAHRSVLYKDDNGAWQDFPYRQYGWGTRYNNMLNNTSKSKSGTVVASCDGTGISSTGEGSTTITNGFDKDKQFMAWIKIEYSQSPNKSDKRKSFYIDFTGKQSDSLHTYRGFAPVSLNNIFTTGSVNVVNKVLMQYGIETVYLRSISLEYQVLDETLWENTDGSTDNSSYRMILKNVGFRNGEEMNPTDLGSTGKTVNEVLTTVVGNGQLHMRMYPAKYRRDDRMVVSKRVETNPRFTILDGKDGNILNIESWDFSPVSDFVNRSLVVFKSLEHGDEHSIYNYQVSRNPREILQYGELTSLVSISDDISSQEAYYEAVKNPNFANRTGLSMTVTVKGCPADLKIGDYVNVVMEDSHYTDYKEVKSITHVYNVDQIPKLQTKIGLNRPEKNLELRDEFESQRKLTKSKKAVFGKTATYNSEDVFKWED